MDTPWLYVDSPEDWGRQYLGEVEPKRVTKLPCFQYDIVLKCQKVWCSQKKVQKVWRLRFHVSRVALLQIFPQTDG